ncbi:flagellar hook-length control protein FliK [Devosia sp. FKR38]|uniref:flagellar hook-length control protein FliK n=1 Tax=Devosia sp. FKR38 TaxID=2562312 RepID=UPI0010C133CF|nr:flagellar hook-length control protein FliK [Devosia sp. FKR38]
MTVTPSSASGAPARAFNAAASTDGNDATDGTFAALLGHAERADKAARGGMAGMIDAALASLAKFTQADGADGEAKDDQSADPQAVAAVIDAPVAFQNDIDVKATFTDLVKDLASLKQSLDAGEAIDPELLKRIDAALETLGAKFNIDLSSDIGNAADDATLSGLLAVTADATTPKAEVTNALAPLIQALRAASAATADPSTAPEIVHPGQLKAVGSKLQALLQALNGKSDTPVDLAALGLADDAKPDADLAAALAKLTTTATKSDAAAAAPTLATPNLKLTEPALTGKGDTQAAAQASSTEGSDSAQAAKPATTAAVTADSGSKPDTGTDKGGDKAGSSDARPDSKPVDAKAPAAAAAAAPDKPVDVQPPAASQPAQVARVDAVAPRVVQAGYQTSQQQLNLPQIAFELVRQVNDGNARFQMRLDPPELGRIDVKLDIGASGHVKAHLIVDKAETLDLMQRDQRALERALQQAGLDSAKTNLEFSLRQSPFSGGQQQGRDQQGNPFGFQVKAGEGGEEAPPTINLYRASLSASGVNIIA